MYAGTLKKNFFFSDIARFVENYAQESFGVFERRIVSSTIRFEKLETFRFPYYRASVDFRLNVSVENQSKENQSDDTRLYSFRLFNGFPPIVRHLTHAAERVCPAFR